MTAVGDGADPVRHLVRDVQRFGLLSAVTVVDRYLDVLDRAMGEAPLVSPRLASEEGDTAWLADSAARMADSWLRVLDATARLVLAAAEPGRDILVLPTTQPGCSSEAALWVNNPTDVPVAAVDLHATTLVSGNGPGLPAEAVSLAPTRVAPVEPGTSREVRVTVEVPPGQPAGQYHGLLLSSAAPDEPIRIRVRVWAADDGEDGRDGRGD